MTAVPTIAAISLGAVLLLDGCSSAPPPGLASPSYSNDHTTAAGEFGLGPESLSGNGGAFGPDRSAAQHARSM